jgi:uncharacterized protein
MHHNIKKYCYWVKIIVLVYALIGIALFSLQNYFLFHPKKINANYKYNFKDSTAEINIPFGQSDTINLVKFFTKKYPRNGIVLYYHGNMENITHYANFVTPFLKNGYEVWMEDYPGFGKSRGVITEQKLYDQALLVKKMAEAELQSDSIVVYGKSLGTGIAAYVASKSNAKKLILETPYYSIPSMFAAYAPIYPTQIMSTFKIPTYQFLENIAYPIVIFHGTNDGVIPYSNAQKLVPLLKPTDKFITVPKADHININATAIYFAAVDSLLQAN